MKYSKVLNLLRIERKCQVAPSFENSPIWKMTCRRFFSNFLGISFLALQRLCAFLWKKSFIAAERNRSTNVCTNNLLKLVSFLSVSAFFPSMGVHMCLTSHKTCFDTDRRQNIYVQAPQISDSASPTTKDWGGLTHVFHWPAPNFGQNLSHHW